MSEERRLTEEEIRGTATGLRDLRWTWRRDEVAGLGQRFGWTQVMESPRGSEFDTGLFPATAEVDIEEDGNVVMVSVPVCTYIDPGSADGSEYLQNVFANTIGVISQAFGEPDRKLPGDIPQVRWRGATSTVGVTLSSVVVTIFTSPNAFLDLLDRYEREDW